MAREWFDLRNIVCVRRMTHFRWEFAPQRGRVREVHPSLGTFRSVTERGLDRLRRRRLRARASPLSVTMGAVPPYGGGVRQVPPDGETFPVQQHVPLALPLFLDSASSISIPHKGGGRDGSMPNVQILTRSEVHFEAPFPQRASTSSQEAKDLEQMEAKQVWGGELHAQHGFRGWSWIDALEPAKEDFDLLARLPVLGWPACQVLFGDVDPSGHLARRTFFSTAIGIYRKLVRLTLIVG